MWRIARLGAGCFAKMVRHFEKNDRLERAAAIRMAREKMIATMRRKPPAMDYEDADLSLTYMIYLAAQPAPPMRKHK